MAAHRPARNIEARLDDDGVELEASPPLLRSVLIIYTGGTIGMKPTPRGYSPAPGYLQELIETMPMFHDTCAACPRSPSQPPPAHLEAGFYEDVRHQTLEQLDRDADVHADLRPPRRNIGRQMISPEDADGRRILFRFLDYDPLMDSSNMTHVEWQRIARDICHYYLRFDGFVVLHGTDTMAYTASALSFFLENLGKPVVLTGSQIPICRQRNDGLMNLVGALNVAAFHHIPEVSLYFSNTLFRGNRSSKTDSGSLNAFESPNMKPLMTVGINYVTNWSLIRPKPYHSLRLHDHFCAEVSILRIFPGEFRTTRSMLADLKGLVLQTFGAGNAPDNQPRLLAALREATDRGCVIVNVTQCTRGEVVAHYTTGSALLDAGVTPAGDMTPEAALTKLCWLLGDNTLTPEQVRERFQQDLRGEITTRATADEALDFKSTGFAKAVYKVLMQTGFLQKRLEDNPATCQQQTIVKEIQGAFVSTLTGQFAANGNLDELWNLYYAEEGQQDQPRPTPRAVPTTARRPPPPLSCASAAASHSLCPVKEDRGRKRARTDCDGAGGGAAGGGGGGRNGGEGVEGGGGGRSGDAGDGGQTTRIERRPARLLLSPNLADYSGRTGLHIAASMGRSQVLDFYLAMPGINVNARDIYGRTPLREACEHGHWACLHLLQAHGATISSECAGLPPGEGKLARTLCKLAADPDSDTAPETKQIALWLAAGADPNAGNYDGRTALHIAASKGYRNLARFLLDKGADPSRKDRFGNTPCDDATREGHSQLLSDLLAAKI